MSSAPNRDIFQGIHCYLGTSDQPWDWVTRRCFFVDGHTFEVPCRYVYDIEELAGRVSTATGVRLMRWDRNCEPVVRRLISMGLLSKRAHWYEDQLANHYDGRTLVVSNEQVRDLLKNNIDKNAARRLVATTRTYFFWDRRSALVKIGRSVNPRSRMQALASSSGRRLELLYCRQGDHEAVLHNLFANERTIGEWFRLPLTVVEKIRSGEFWRLYRRCTRDPDGWGGYHSTIRSAVFRTESAPQLELFKKERHT
jgi:hypothetical protein